MHPVYAQSYLLANLPWTQNSQRSIQNWANVVQMTFETSLIKSMDFTSCVLYKNTWTTQVYSYKKDYSSCYFMLLVHFPQKN